MKMLQLNRRASLQAKIILVLVAVIIPTFLITTVAENKLTGPALEEEMKQVGITSAKSMAADIVSRRLLSLANPTPAIERNMQEFLYTQPNVTRMDVYTKDPATGQARIVGSNIEDEPGVTPPPAELVENVRADYKVDDSDIGYWDIYVPIEQRGRDAKAPRKFLGTIHVVVSLKIVDKLVSTLWRSKAFAAIFSVMTLIIALNYFLRKTIENDRRLRRAEDANLALTEKLHEAQRQIMNTEKLAVMGQLTASFAHEIGTPLNAIGGHLQLLREEIAPQNDASTASGGSVINRLDIVNGQLNRIEQTVKNFLQTTTKPSSQRQLVDLNKIADQTLSLVKPRSEVIGVDIRREFDRTMGPVRVVPLDVEQVLLNLVNNSLDSLKAKRKDKAKKLELRTEVLSEQGKDWAVLSVYDTGEGIGKADLKNVLKPFFTTKPPGQGTGLGLAICQEIAMKYGGMIEIDSKEGSWTRVSLKLPYQVTV